MGTAPGAWVFVTALIWVGDVTVKLAAVVEPNLTAVALVPITVKFVPTIVTVDPPPFVPVTGLKEERVGGGAMNVNLLGECALPAELVTLT